MIYRIQVVWLRLESKEPGDLHRRHGGVEVVLCLLHHWLHPQGGAGQGRGVHGRAARGVQQWGTCCFRYFHHSVNVKEYQYTKISQMSLIENILLVLLSIILTLKQKHINMYMFHLLFLCIFLS